MQLSDRPARPALTFVVCVSIVAALTACSEAEADSDSTTSNGTANTTKSGGSTSGETGTGGATGSSTTQGDGPTTSGGAAGAGCSVEVASHALDSPIHVTECSAIEYSTNPPASGRHYPVWAFYQSYDFPVPRGYWVHSLEHGAVVITYNCPEGCPDEVARAKTFIDSLPVDPRCVPYDVDRQVILTPDPLLDTRWAMSSWGHTLRADCIDEEAFRDFYESNVAHGPEDICGGGAALTEAALPPDCGE